MANPTTTWGQVYRVGVLVLQAVAVVMIISGSVMLFKAVFKTVAFDKYPLPSYLSTPATSPDGKTVQQNVDDIATQRKLQELEDYSGAISMILVSGGLFWLARVAKKHEE